MKSLKFSVRPRFDALEDRTTPARFDAITPYYEQILNRLPDAAGIAAWSSVAQTNGVAAMVRGIWESPEHRGLEVDAVYQRMLHRVAEPAGRQAWINLFGAGYSEEHVAFAIAASPEYQALHPGSKQLVDAMFNDLLGRPASAADEAAWLNRSAGAIASGLVSSPEYANGVVGSFYATYLGGGNPTGQAAFVADLTGHRTTVTRVAEAIIGSAPFAPAHSPQFTQDVSITWINQALAAIQTDGTPPPKASRGLAMVSLAMFDAVMAIEKIPTYLVNVVPVGGLFPEVAAGAAAFQVLSSLYPAQATTLNQAFAQFLAQAPDGLAKTAAIAYGKSVGAAVLAARANDGATTAKPYTPVAAPGEWQPTPPANAAALLPQWADVAPFSMTSPSQFRPAGPPALTSQAWADAFNEVKSVGSATSITRTADQTQIAKFWADGAGTVTPPGHWNAIAAQVAASKGKTFEQNVRMFAMLNVALADAGITAWNTKYAFHNWRPITAIRNADTDNNAATVIDPSWTPLLTTPPFPEYISGHSTFSSAAATVLSSLFGTAFGFTTDGVVDGATVQRSFASFVAAAAEAGQSRIYGGIHYQFSNVDGLAAGQALAQNVLSRFAST